jgi:2-phosphosulfolactate phosphatase
VVIDVLRATTTIIEALSAGAASVVPCLTIEDARARLTQFGPDNAVLGGERGGRPIAGFDLGNSPAEYTTARLRGRTVVLTTTNGTKTLVHCRSAKEILVAAFVNLSAVTDRLLRAVPSLAINIVCAGTDGVITREDVLVAGAIVAGLNPNEALLNDQALLARDAWLEIAADRSATELAIRLTTAMQESRGGRNLIEIGMAADIELAARIDRHASVPTYDALRGLIEAGARRA